MTVFWCVALTHCTLPKYRTPTRLQPRDGVGWHTAKVPKRNQITRETDENEVDEMAKGQVKKEKTNKAKLSPKEKKKLKAAKKAAKAAR